MAEEKKERVFVGLTKVKTFQNGGKIIKLGMKMEDLQPHVNDGGWVNLIIARKKDADGTGEKDYYTYIDDYVPKPKEN